jgi:hypothetical protein
MRGNGIEMPLIERFRPQLPIRIDADLVAWYPHNLVIAVSGPAEEKWTQEKLAQVAQACASALAESFNTIEFFWGDFFDEWAIDLISQEGAMGLIGASGGDREILGGRYLARIVFPASLFPAAPNPRGNQSGSTHPVEGKVQEAIKAHLYLMHRFIVGFHSGGKRVTPAAMNQAVEDIRPLIKAVLHLTDVNQRAGSTAERDDKDADRFLEMCIEQGPRCLGQLMNDRTNKLAGDVVFRHGANERTAYLTFNDSKVFAGLLAEYKALADAWERARLIRLGEQSARRSTWHGPVPISEALALPGISAEQMAQIAGISKHGPSLQVIADVARRHEFDLTTCHPTLQYARPLAVAMSAVAAFERRAASPSRDAVDGVIAHHAIAAMEKDTFTAEAGLNGFGRDWPTEKLKELAMQLKRPLPRLNTIIPEKIGRLV